jgi:hypothetical protein
MEELLNALLPHLVQIAQILLTGFAAWLGIIVKSWLEDQKALVQAKTTQEQFALIEKIIAHSVNFVEQVAVDLKSEEKLELAYKTAVALANEKGLDLTEEQLKVVTESFVKEFFGHIEDVVRLEGTE